MPKTPDKKSLPVVGTTKKGVIVNKTLQVKSIQSSVGSDFVPRQSKLPNASVIYGMAASALFVVALYFLLTGLWFTGLLVLLPAGCFLGFALHFLKHAG